MDTPWRIKLFGWLRAERGDLRIHRFSTQKAGALLAYLAYHNNRPHAREVLMEMLWPEADPDVARNRFRVTLNALRRQLEPEGTEPGSVLIADRSTVRLHPDVTTDVQAFEQLLAEACRSEDSADRCRLLLEATGLYTAELLPGFYDTWIEPERTRLAAVYMRALCGQADCLERGADLEGAVDAMRRAVSADPHCEESHQRLISLLLAAGQPAGALRQYREMKRRLQDGLGRLPSGTSRALLDKIREHLRAVPDTADLHVVNTPNHSLEESEDGPTLPATLTRSQLPVPLTRFIGREEELERLITLMKRGEDRLITLTGPGGSGKTRLALEAAARLTTSHDAAIWFVPLAERHDPALILDSIYTALGLKRLPTMDPMDQLASAFGRERGILVLDTFEQLVDDGAVVVRDLLLKARALTCVVTSQVRLQVEGERELPVPPLPTPERSMAPEVLQEFASVRLFVDRARAVLPGFEVNGGNADAVAALCHRLEGIPLALELAAAWVHMMSPTQMLERLTDRFDLLVTRRRDRLDRHRTLRATLDWSYGLLPRNLQRLYTHLSVFRGGWTLDGAVAVCGVPEPVTIGMLADLRERSFLVCEPCGSGMRFWMLETLREYAASLLAPEDRDTLIERHTEYYLGLAEQSDISHSRSDLTGWMDHLEQHIDNLRAALDASLLTGGDPSKALRLSSAMLGLWEHRGHLQEGRSYLARALTAAQNAAPEYRLRALNAASRLAVCQGAEAEGTPLAREALEMAQIMGDLRGEAFALRNLAFASYIRADFPKAAALQEKSLALFRQLDDPWGIAALLDDLGSVVSRMGEYHRARRLMEESLEVNRSLNHREGIASALFGLGVIARDLGEWETARELLEESLQYGEMLGEKLLSALCLNALGTVHAEIGDLMKGRKLIEDGHALFRELRDSRGEFFSLYHLGMAVLRRNNPRRGMEMLRESLRLSLNVGDRRYALYNVDGLATLAAEAGEPERAICLFAWSEDYARDMGHPWPPYRAEDRNEVIASVRRTLGEDRFASMWEKGRGLSLQDVTEPILATA